MSTHETFSKIDQVLDHQKNYKIKKKIKIIPVSFLIDGMKLEINGKVKTKIHKYVKI